MTRREGLRIYEPLKEPESRISSAADLEKGHWTCNEETLFLSTFRLHSADRCNSLWRGHSTQLSRKDQCAEHWIRYDIARCFHCLLRRYFEGHIRSQG